MTTSNPLYVARLYLKDIRCFKHLEIDFSKPGESIVLIGDNGAGKSTVLRSLAMGICDQSSASALFRELHGDYVRDGAKAGTIEVDLVGSGGHRYRIITHVKSVGEVFERVDQKWFRLRITQAEPLDQDKFPWHRIFASGYGAGLRVQGTADSDYYLTADAVYPLFRYDTPLHNPELIVRRLVDAARRNGDKAEAEERAEEVLREIQTMLARILQLDKPENVSLEPDGIYVHGPWGKVGLAALADGFRGTVTWILDLIAWWFVYRRSWGKTKLDEVRGIVVIDEIEQHLHPRWQRNVMRLLKESFPHVQFIATTHSPLVASGCEGIPVHRLAGDTHTTEHPFGWLAEDVYQMMGLPSSRSEPFEKDVLNEFADLDIRRLRGQATPHDLSRLEALRIELDRLPDTDSTKLLAEIQNITKRIQEEAGQTGSTGR